MRLLANRLRCAPNRVEIIRGAGSRQKRVLLHGFTEAEVRSALEG